MFRRSLFAALACLITITLNPALAQSSGKPEGVIPIPYEKFVLANGLRLVVHEDHKAPIVAVNIWYDVGSADERQGKTGFAHLFEHLMFNGSENYNDDYFKPFDRVGATGMNGTTSEDRTNYFQVVPTTALDMALWMESDRMGHLLGAIDQPRLDEQRGVVQNEKRQGENEPYGKDYNIISENIYPHGHPYDHLVIGSMEDLNAASLADVQEWFKTYYGPTNAVLVVAGDVNPKDVKARVERYFGDIPAGPPLTKPVASVNKRTESSRFITYDRVPQDRIYKVWNVPPIGDPEVEDLDILSDILTLGKNSRLYKRLVYQDQIATDVTSFNYSLQLGGAFIIIANAQPNGDLAAVERAIDEELDRLLREGINKEELERSRTSKRAGFIRGIERIGGFGGKSDILAASEVYLGSPDAHEAGQARILTTSAKQVIATGRKWLSSGDFNLEVHAFPEFSAAESQVDRKQGVPEVKEFPTTRFPDREEFKLANGLKVLLTRRTAIPVLELDMLFNAGYAADKTGLPGTASLALGMLDEGTTSRTSLEISADLDRLGASLGAGSDLDLSSVSMSALKENLDASLDLYADVILNPAFPAEDFERLRRQQLAAILNEKSSPQAMALRVFPRLLYGEGHAYDLPLTGSGTEESVKAIDIPALRGFHSAWVRPNNATLIVVGDVTREELEPRLNKLFAKWQPGEIPTKNLAAVDHQAGSGVYIIDRPGAEQSLIFAGHIMPPRSDPADLPLDALNQILGGAFSSRLNMNLREDKHWSYGARSGIVDTAAQRPFIVMAPVQTDKTKESLAEVLKELQGVLKGGARPATAEELAKVKDQKTLTLPGRWETNAAVLGDIVEIERFSLPKDYWNAFASEVRGLDLEDIAAVTDKYLRPDRMIWVVVGDRAKIEAGIKELNLGAIHYIDADGNPAGQ
ncbi:MAG: insulinase family protein [Gammaproteobacteria bacterium]|nr:MAG: insulinase family protein [Gammaproteobacteria bacterium]